MLQKKGQLKPTEHRLKGSADREFLQWQRVNAEKLKEIFAPEKETFLRKAKKTLKKYPYWNETLMILAGLGTVGLAVMMPGLGRVVAQEVRDWEKQRYRRMWEGLEKRKLVKVYETPQGTCVEITKDGRKQALKYKISTMKIKEPNKWDGKWRIVIFDVAEAKKKRRDVFRDYLKQLNFYMLNRSVFVHPFSCFDEVEFLRQISGVGEDVTYIVADLVETSSDLKEHFNL